MNLLFLQGPMKSIPPKFHFILLYHILLYSIILHSIILYSCLFVCPTSNYFCLFFQDSVLMV